MKQLKRLKIENLAHAFDNKPVLESINLELKQGKVMAVVGRSGCGKTTLLNLIADLLEVDQGSIINDFSSSAVLFQDSRLLPWKTSKDNIAWGMKAQGINRKERDNVARKLASDLGLTEADLEKYPHELSGGMKQRVAMARSFAVKPELLLLDEPFSALDIGLKEDLYSLLIEQIEQQALTVLFITHDLMEAVKLADEIIVLTDTPGRQAYRYLCDRPRKARDQAYIYENAMALINKQVVKNAFRTGTSQ